VPALLVALGFLGVSLIACPSSICALPERYAFHLPGLLGELRHECARIVLPTLRPTIELAALATPTSYAQPSALPSPSYRPTFTPASTPTPTPTPTLTPTSTPTPVPTLPASALLAGLRHERQGWNNCGPTTLAMALSYWGRDETQYDIVPFLKPDSQDKHVGLGEMEEYVQSLGLDAIVRVGGTLDQLKALVHAGFPVIVETWYVRDADDQLGHYRLIVGYDDVAQEFTVYDSLHDPVVTMGYQELDELWHVFNRVYLVVYSPEKWEDLASILGPDLSDKEMYERALETARVEAALPPQDCVAYADCVDWVTFSWFNAGTNLTLLGQHVEAVAAYDRAWELGVHRRMLWYQFGPYKSYYAVGRYDDVIALANATLATAGNLEESYYWRAMARLAQGDADGARADLEAALHYHDNWQPAVIALEAM
jgi:hypothetical protein